MGNLVLKDENLLASPPVVGYKVLGLMDARKANRISIYDVADHFKNEKWFSPKILYYAMIFLFTLGIIDFKNSYILKKK